ncbi:MAG: GIDE domain-containing protein [Anaerolineales bacterium]
MDQIAPEVLLRALAFLGIACFCGLVPLLFAAVAFYAKGKHGEIGESIAKARRVKISALQPDMGLVRLQGRIAPIQQPLDGTPENGLVYLRLQVEKYVSADTTVQVEEHVSADTIGWKPFADKWYGIPFQIEDDTGQVWVNPEGMDRHFLGDEFVPDDAQIQNACILLEISPDMLRGKLRFHLWELRAGQEVTVIGAPTRDAQGNLVIAKSAQQPLLISRWLELDEKLSAQTRQARNWVLFLGIPGLLFLICGCCGALVSLLTIPR